MFGPANLRHNPPGPAPDAASASRGAERTASTGVRHRYPATVDFFVGDEGELQARIETERLCLQAVAPTLQAKASCAALYASPEVMCRYGSGDTKSPAEVDEWLRIWSERWQGWDPFSAFTVQLQDTDEFVGTTVLSHTGAPGQAEFAFTLLSKFWNRRYGTECASAVVHAYADELVAQKIAIDGAPFGFVRATARTDNPGSYRCLTGLGFTKVGEAEKYGAPRFHYLLPVGIGTQRNCLVQASLPNAAADVSTTSRLDLHFA